MPLVTALDSVGGIRPVLGLFEGVCTGAADGFGRMAGRPAMTLLHLGPGLANGLANLHNARRVGTPVVNLVGDHATWHLACDSPLTSDIRALAATVGWVHGSVEASALGADLAEAVSAAARLPGRVATLIVPADLQAAGVPPAVAPPLRPAYVPDSSRVAAAVEALRRGRSTGLYLGGGACRDRALAHAARIAGTSGCRIFVETFPARMERGAGTPRIERFGYFPEQISGLLEGIGRIVLVGAPDPVAMFGWPGAPSRMLPAHVDVVSLARVDENAGEALAAVAEAFAPRRRGRRRLRRWLRLLRCPARSTRTRWRPRSRRLCLSMPWWSTRAPRRRRRSIRRSSARRRIPGSRSPAGRSARGFPARRGRHRVSRA